MNKITCNDGNGEGPCIVCGTMTTHYHSESKHPNNTAHICKENCCTGPKDLKLVVKTYECAECGRTTETPALLPNDVKMCPHPDCRTIFPAKELQKIED